MVTKRFLAQGGIYTLTNFAVAGIPFLLLPVFTRYLDPAAFGTVAMFTLLLTVLNAFVGLNIHGAIMIRYFDRAEFDVSKYVSTSIAVMLITALLMLAVITLSHGMISRFTGLSIFWLSLSVVLSSLQFLIQVLLILLQASKNAISYGAIRLLQALLEASLSVILIVVLALSWQGRISALFATAVIISALSIYFLIRKGWLSTSLDFRYAKDGLRYGVGLIPHVLGGVLLGMTDRFLITNLIDVSSTGVYMVAVQIGLILGLLTDSFNKAFAPWLFETLRTSDYKKKIVIVRYTYLYFVVITMLSVVFIWLAPFLISLMVGPEYQDSRSLINYIIVGNAFIGMYYMVTNYIFVSRRTELLSMLTITVGVFSTILCWQLIQMNGVVGAAQSFMIGQILLFVGAWVLSNYCVRMPWLSCFKLAG